MKIEIWSDIMCPFCYIGKKNFEKALSEIPYKNDIQVIWRSFQLDDNLSKKESISTIEYLKSRKNIEENQIEEMFSRLNVMGKEAGIDFHQDTAKVVNTGDAHRLIAFAHTKGKGTEAKEALLYAYFTAGENVADYDALAIIGEKIGLVKTEVLEMLNSDAFVFEVAGDILDARALGVSSVPFFAIDRKYALSGAQSVEYFMSAITQAYEKHYITEDDSTVDTCGIDGNC